MVKFLNISLLWEIKQNSMHSRDLQILELLENQLYENITGLQRII